MKKIAYSLMALAIAAFTFTSCEDVPAPFGQPSDPGSDDGGDVVVIEPSGSGTEADPYNVAAALEIASKLSASDAGIEMVAQGYISSIDEMSTEHGNCTYYISDDKDGKANKLEVYRGKGLNGAAFTTGEEIKQGDLVVVKGTVVNFKGNTLEFTTGSILLSINGVGGGDTPSTETLGTKDAPLNIAAALAEINKLSDGGESSQFAYVKGKVVKVTTNQANFDQYGNLNYLISEDGTENGSTITVYSGDGLNGAKFTSPNDLAQGDEVIVYGKLYKYVNKSGAVTPEINKGNYLVSLVKGSGGGGGGTEAGLGTADKPLTVAKALEIVNALADNGETETEAFVKGKISKVQSFSDKYKSITYYISDDGTENNELQIYSGKGLNGAEFAAVEDLSAGDVVVVKGKLKKYVNSKTGATTLEMNQPNEIVSITKASGGGDEPSGDGSEITAVFGELGISGDLSVVTLADGTKLTFAQGGGKNPPIYHSSTSIIRMYAQNEVTIDAGSKKISKVVFAYDTYNGTAYKGNDEMYGQAGNTKITPTKDDANVTFSGVNSSTLKVVNDFTSNSGGTQFRITGVTIIYAN